MIQTGFEKRVKVQQVIEGQLPEFLRTESPKSIDFFKQYYVSQEYQGGPTDIVENLDQYLKFDNLTPEVISGSITLSENISEDSDTIQVSSTKGFPSEYGLLKIDDEIITYTGKTTSSFTGCIRGFSGISAYKSDLNPEELVFTNTSKESHRSGASVQNLSALFLKEFYNKLKYTFAPGLEDTDFVSDLDVNNFLKEIRSFYESKGTEESFKILFKILYGVNPTIVDLENYLNKPSGANYRRRKVVVAQAISGDPNKLVGQTIKKSSDLETQAAVSEVEIFSRPGTGSYFKIGLFIGFDDNSLIEGTFTIPAKTRVINPVTVGSSVITVDSTVGFEESGTVICGNNTITYKNKTINQFLDCTGIETEISSKQDLRSDEVYFGYEDGDITKKVELRLTGVIESFHPVSDILLSNEGQKIFTQNVGEKINNPEVNKTNKEIFANSWTYNTSTRFFVDRFEGSTVTLKTNIDKSSLKVGDTVNILSGITETVIHENAVVNSVISNNQITLGNLTGFVYNSNDPYSIRRNLNTASSTGADIFYGNDSITSDIQNVYSDDKDNMYVAANSLPSYNITRNIIESTIPSLDGGTIQGFDGDTEKYSIISFPSDVKFKTGDEVLYTFSDQPLEGLVRGSYFVRVLNEQNKIKIYSSRSLIESDIFQGFTTTTSAGSHTFTLFEHGSKNIYPQKILKKFPLNPNLKNGNHVETTPGSTGILVNGVEIINYKSNDKIYYGPLDGIDLYNQGEDYDVISLPEITIDAPGGSNTQALVNPVIRGSIKEVKVDPQNFDLVDVTSVTLKGGNGSGAVLEPVVETRFRELEFDPRDIGLGGGIDINDDTLTFPSSHNLKNGEALVYNSNGNDGVGISTLFKGLNTDQDLNLVTGSVYFPEIVNNSTIKLYNSFEDYSSGINTVGFTTTFSQGTHKFRLLTGKKTLTTVKVVNPGSGYENRKLKVKSDNISTIENTITFKNHGFNHGDQILYSTDGTSVTGLNQNDTYSIIKIDDDTFKLANSGIGGTDTSNFERNLPVDITATGTGIQNFAYPDIELVINSEFAGTSGVITATPYVRGKIVDLYLYETGTGYGSTILNFEKRPSITIKNGKNAEIFPIVDNGKIISAKVTNGGSEYNSTPDIIIVGKGIGASIRPVISNGRIVDTVLINGGVGYDENTSIKVVPAGRNANIDVKVRALTLNNHDRYGNDILTSSETGLKFGQVGLKTSLLSSEFNDDGTSHSPIIGWAYDGNPIYGPYGYSDPDDANSELKLLKTSYVKKTSHIFDRPSGFSNGFFVEDYKYVFNSSKDLDEHNGRYEKTPEFPNGVYAYHFSLVNNKKTPKFPYFIGDTYRSLPINQNIDQSFDFNSSSLVRNTFPYKVNDPGTDNDFIVEPNEILNQSATIDSITEGSVEKLNVINAGSDYKVGESLKFDNTDTNGGGISADIKSVTGQSILDCDVTIDEYTNSILTWKNDKTVTVKVSPSHTVLDGHKVVISGISTDIPKLNRSHIVGVTSEKARLALELEANNTAGFVTDLYVSTMPSRVAVGATLGIGTETLTVLGTYPSNKVIRVLRGLTGTAHSAFTSVSFLPDTFSIPISVPYFESSENYKTHFNPTQAVGIGTTLGASSTKKYQIGNRQFDVDVPYQSIYLPGHALKTGQEITFEKVAGSNAINASSEADSSLFTLPRSGNSDTLYVIRKNSDYIGLSTLRSDALNSDGVFFRSFTTNGDSRDFRYSIESNNTQVTAKVEEVVAKVTLTTAHSLKNGDIIELSLSSNKSVGIGTSTKVRVKYESSEDRVVLEEFEFGSSDVSTSSHTITISDHGFVTGDKVFYSASTTIGGLSQGQYFVYRVDDDKFSLGFTEIDILKDIPKIINFTSTGGSTQNISLVNPPIQVIRSNDLVFDVSDTSLSDRSLKLFYDNEYKNELVSIGSTTEFSVVRSGTPGSADATVTLNYNENLPFAIFYQLEKSGVIGTSDSNVKNFSQISFVDSEFNGSYKISGVANTTFNISLDNVPEVLTYTQDDTKVLKYSTTSKNVTGGVDSLRIISSGFNYKKLPKFVSIASTTGKNADILPESKTIGRINQVTINDPGFDFASDKTLRPEVFVSPNTIVVDKNTITEITIDNGGSGYSSPPDIVVVNPDTREVSTDGLILPTIQGSSIGFVEIVKSPRGLSDSLSEIFTVNNSNGVGINSVYTSNSGIVTCVIETPTLGFNVGSEPFAVNDSVFSENITLSSTDGKGFNSADHGYRFFNVVAYRNTNPAEVEFDISEYATSDAGTASVSQTEFASLVNKKNYPVLKPTQELLNFTIGETISVKIGGTFTTTDIKITESLIDSIKFYGFYELKSGDTILGNNSGCIATIKSIDRHKAFFNVEYGLDTNYGWSDDIGKLNTDNQVIADNDYYQNLSYTIKSPITYDTWVNPVNRLIHSTGLKNFADVGITSEGNVAIATSEKSTSTALIDISDEKRVDMINFFDFGIDIDVANKRSKFIKLQNKRLTDYIECKTNRVLTIDNFSKEFSNQEDANSEEFADIDNFITNSGYSRYLIQAINPDTNDIQSTEILYVNTPSDGLITVEKGSIHNTGEDLVDIEAVTDENGESVIRLTPQDVFNDDLDVKFYKQSFNTTLAGIGTKSIGFVDITASNDIVDSGNTETIFEKTTEELEAVFANFEVIDKITKDKTIVEMFIDHDNTDTYKSDLFFDNNQNEGSARFIGTFTSDIDSGVFSINYENDDSNSVLVRSRIVGFGTTGVGIGTHTFKATGQADTSVREGRLTSTHSTFTGITTISSFDKEDVTTVKSTIRVSYGNTSALHQVLYNHNVNDAFIVQYPFISIGSTSGIGSFGAEIDGSEFNLLFYPDSNFTGIVTTQSYNEIIQSKIDLNNIPATLVVGTSNEKLVTSTFDSVNGTRTNKFDFDVKHLGTPILEKQFDPSVTSVLNLGTGEFTIPNHFFSDREELIYTPRSTFIGESSTSIVMSDGNVLPTTVYVIKEDNDTFKLSTTKTGAAVTFNSAGTGNGHTLEMSKKLEKSLITIDGISRAPLAYSPINYTLQYNPGGSISTGSTYISISGISSILPGDVMKIEDEYVRVDAVGLGTTTAGPITGIGTYKLLKSVRGFVGTSATSHDNSTEIRLYQGSYNMTRSKIHFTEAPRGNVAEVVDKSNIPYAKSTFNGRIFLKSNYDDNKIYDNISRQFTGIGATYTLTVGGANTTGIETGSGLVFINNIFQTPTTKNNVGGNYEFEEEGSTTNIVFSGNRDSSDDLIISEIETNPNLLPRGGMIVSLGSTQGLGVAPLVGAAVTAVVSGGVIQNSVGLGTTDQLGSGYYGTVSIGVTDSTGSGAVISATVGAGGTLSFTVTNGGTGYSANPTIEIPSPSYENLSIIGSYREGIGNTTDTGKGLLLNIEVGAAVTSVGIGSTLHEVSNFKIVRPGFGFNIGDKFKVVGLVTARGLNDFVIEPEFEVLDIFTDNFSAWQFGELDFIDSIGDLIDGKRTRFPLFYNGDLLSFEIDRNDPDSANIDLEAILLVYINGVIQTPNTHYNFVGGTSINFIDPPTANDDIDIFFYRGTRGTDSLQVDVNETVKPGDIVRLLETSDSVLQDPRTITKINTSDKVETGIYLGVGIDEDNFKPVSWTKQKRDKNLAGEKVTKIRDSIETMVFPTAKIIGDLSDSGTEIFVDNAQFFNYEENESSIVINEVKGLIVNTTIDPVGAAITATVNSSGEVSALTINSGGSGYSGSATVKIAAPKEVGVGVGTTATATVTISNGEIDSVTIVDGGMGYATTLPPQVIVSSPPISIETVATIDTVVGFAATITGISTSVGSISNGLALEFAFSASDTSDLNVGYPIFVHDTRIGDGVTSIDGSDTSTVGIGTTFLDNVYIIDQLSKTATTGVATCSILSTTPHSDLSATGSISDPRGFFSWGRLSGVTRSTTSPISIGVTGLTVDSGLSTFPTIQRRGYGLRDNGSLKKDLG